MDKAKFLFAFTYEGAQYLWGKKFLKGFKTPLLFSLFIYKKSEEQLVPPEGSVIIQCTDDSLVASETKKQRRTATLALLQFLASWDHKASLDKTAVLPSRSKYLEHLLSAEGHKVSQSGSQPNLHIRQPTTRKQLGQYWRLVGCYR